MPTVLLVGPYRFFFVSVDNPEPPHIHVRREKMVAKFWLNPVVLERTGSFSRTEVNRIIGLINENRDFFLEKWHEYFGS